MSASVGPTIAPARTTATTVQAPGSIALRKLSALVSLTKPRIIELLLITTLPTMIVAAGGLPSPLLIIATLAGGTLAAGGANALNMVYDKDIDSVMGRTKGRPLVTGAIRPSSALLFALVLEVGAFVELWRAVNLLSAVLAISAMAFYVGVYTVLLKRSTSQNIVIGGAAGAAPVLVGWAAVTDHVGLAPILIFGVVFLWTPPHFWALAVRYRDDYSLARVPMLPSVASPKRVGNEVLAYAAALVALSLAAAVPARLGVVYVASAGILGAIFIVKAALLRAEPTPKRAMGLFHYSISYLTLLFVAMAVDVFLPAHL